jgi:FkbM family methyltransferase
VVAIEPAAVNYFLLAANAEANELNDRIDCLLLGLGAGRSVARLDVSQFSGANSFSFRTDRQRYAARQTALVLSMDELVEDYGLPCPNYIKIDTPGMIEPILAGAARTLRRPDVREVHIELRDKSKAGQRVLKVLEECGLSPRDRHTHGATTDVTFVRTGPR